MPLKILQSKESRPFDNVKNILAIAAGKGGVGKSSVTVNLALALKQAGYRVGVMDTDIYGPTVRKMLPEDRLPLQKQGRITPALCQGIKMISMAYFRPEKEAAAVRAPIANGIIGQFIKEVDWGELDYLLLDFPPGTGDIQLTLSQQANLSAALLVTTPQEVSLLDVRKALHLFQQVQVPVLGIVENMSYYCHPGTQDKVLIFGKGGGDRLALEAGVPLLATIPIDPAICRAGDLGKSLFAQDPEGKTPAVQAFAHLAIQVVAHLHLLKENGGSPVRRIWQKDPWHFSIEWNDDTTKDYRLSDLQRQCPCAGCIDESTGQRRHISAPFKDDVGVESIVSVGRYALRLRFSSGCTNGIYTFAMLKDFFHD